MNTTCDSPLNLLCFALSYTRIQLIFIYIIYFYSVVFEIDILYYVIDVIVPCVVKLRYNDQGYCGGFSLPSKYFKAQANTLSLIQSPHWPVLDPVCVLSRMCIPIKIDVLF